MSKDKFSIFDDISVKGEPEVKVGKADNREKKKNRALLKKAANKAKKFRKDEEESVISGKKFDRIAEMRKRRKQLLED